MEIWRLEIQKFVYKTTKSGIDKGNMYFNMVYTQCIYNNAYTVHQKSKIQFIFKKDYFQLKKFNQYD